MSKLKKEYVVAEIERGFRMNGKAVFPAKADEKGKKTEPRRVKLEKRFAEQLQSASKVKICPEGTKENYTDLPTAEEAGDDFDAAFKE